MFKNIKALILIATTGLLFGVPLLAPAIASAASCSNNITTGIASGLSDTTGSFDCGAGNTNVSGGIKSIAGDAVNIFSIIVGVVAVIMIIYGGFRYITSGGDSGKVGNAKNTLIYAIIGLIIVALSQLIVHYVLNESSTVNSSASAGVVLNLAEPRL